MVFACAPKQCAGAHRTIDTFLPVAVAETFAGIRPADAPLFLVAQFAGARAATLLFRWLVPGLPAYATDVLIEHSVKSSVDSAQARH